MHLCALFFLSRLEWEKRLAPNFLPRDPAVRDFLRELRDFGDHDQLLLLIESPQRLEEHRLLEHLRNWRQELERLPGVIAVRSFLDLPTFDWNGSAEWRIGRLADKAHPLAEAGRNPLARQGFFRRDGRGTAVCLELDPKMTESFSDLRSVRRAVRNWIEL